MIPLIDTHQHLWDLEKFKLAWVEGLPPLNKSHLIGDYMAVTKEANVAQAIYMEVDVDPAQRIAEAEYVFELCAQADNPMAGAVISADPAADDFQTHLNQVKGNPYLKGIRQVLHVPDRKAGACLADAFVKGVQWLGEQGLSFDICMRPAELTDGVQLVARCPDTQFILDHCGNPDPKIVNGADPGPQNAGDIFWHTAKQWKQDIVAYAEHENVVCKLSGIVARAPAGWTAADLAPIINHCIDSFGPDRVIFGGDWPVCTLVATYQEWAAALREIIADRSEGDQTKILHDNARQLYGLA